MSQPGWYPDPEGGRDPRYWDGTRWLERAPRRHSRGLWFFLGGLAVVVVVVVALMISPGGLVAGPSTVDTRSHRPSVQPWDELSATPEEPGDTVPGGAQPEECPSVGMPHSEVGADNRLHGGGLSIEAPDSPRWVNQPTYMPWMSEQNSMSREIVPGWVASIDVGAVRHEDGFSSPRMAAQNMVSCMASSWMFQGFTHSETLVSEVFTIDGNDGWHIRENIYVTGWEHEDIAGDVLDVYVIDLGRDGELAVLVGCATIDHTASVNEVRSVLETLRVG
ncbi:MAG: DUF2510 domain-containing protein [Propionibacterium sp.]|nr:DUF2510 domain-containing protein [Propionibacterium sp.]